MEEEELDEYLESLEEEELQEIEEEELSKEFARIKKFYDEL